MTPAELALVAVSQLRDLEVSPNDYPTALFAPVARFARAQGIQDVVLTWVPPTGHLMRTRVGVPRGVPSAGASRQVEVSVGTGARKLRIASIELIGDSPDDQPFDAALDAVVDAFADACFRHLERFALARREGALTRLSELEREERPGTALTRALAKLAQTVRAYHGLYAALDGSALVPIYGVPGHRQNAKGATLLACEPVRVSDRIEQALRRQRATEWRDTNGELARLFHDLGLGNDVNCHYYMQSVQVRGLPVGLFLLGVAEGTPTPLESYADVLAAYAQRLERPARFLYQRSFCKVNVDPIFASRDTRVDDLQVFVMMPFTLPWSARIWDRVVKPTLEGVGLNALRADDLYGRDVVEDIWQGILRSRLLVADITGRNPNVFYELGLAHTLGKDVILLTQEVDDIPFDLNRFRHIIYADNMDGYDVLRSGLIESARHILRLP